MKKARCLICGQKNPFRYWSDDEGRSEAYYSCNNCGYFFTAIDGMETDGISFNPKMVAPEKQLAALQQNYTKLRTLVFERSPYIG